MKIKSIITVTLILLFSKINAQNATFEKRDAFLFQFEKTNNIDWGYLNVPETWESSNGKKIKIAVAILKNTSNIKNTNAVVFIQGGPGAGGIDNIWSWIDHPLRKNNDIILFDVRGTGYSEPRLSKNLGEKFLAILAKNQSRAEDEKQKTSAVMSMKQELLNKKYDIDSYNSLSTAQDLHALKSVLGYKNWNVYGVSYGTYIAQVYADAYPQDIKTVLLDSPVYDISTYYVNNTSNYMNSLHKVFEICKNDKQINAQYPNLEQTYYNVIADLEKRPLTVDVDKSIIPTGKFTYNAEDFKVAIQQALYNKQLVEVIPLLIYQFHKREEAPLGNLVSAFSNLLGMDYGVYYCMTCNEAIPNNDYSKFKQNTAEYKQLKGGISFYESDFKVCSAWNTNRAANAIKHYDLSKLSSADYPVLVFSGEFDPITPLGNGQKVAERFKNGHFIEAKTYGHVPAFTKIGRETAEKFINNPEQKINAKAFDEAAKIAIVTGVTLNKGVSVTGKSISQPDPIFLIPLLIALVIMLVFAAVYIIKLIKNIYTTKQDKILRIAIIITSLIGLSLLGSLIMAILEVSKKNFFVLAFGLPENFNYVFSLVSAFFILLALTFAYYIITIKKTNDRSIVFTVIFSNVLLATYLLYWGIL